MKSYSDNILIAPFLTRITGSYKRIALVTYIQPEANKGSGDFFLMWMNKLTHEPFPHNTINMQKCSVMVGRAEP